MDRFMEPSPFSALLAQFIGGCSNSWTSTCKAAKRYAETRGCCSCQYRFRYLLNVAEQDESHGNCLLWICRMSSDVPYLPVCFFWYARITSVFKQLDERSGLTHTCLNLSFRREPVEGLRCISCTDRDVPVWVRGCELDDEDLYYVCSKCLIQTHEQIKHSAATAELEDDTFQRTVDKWETITEDVNFLYIREFISPAIYGTILRTRICPKRCAYCQPTWTGWYCDWCGVTGGDVRFRRLWYYDTNEIPGFADAIDDSSDSGMGSLMRSVDTI